MRRTSVTISNAGSLGSGSSANVKLTKGVLALNSANTYNAWATTLAGGYLRNRIGNSTYAGNITVSANSGMGSNGTNTLNITGTVDLGNNTLTASPRSKRKYHVWQYDFRHRQYNIRSRHWC